ncbi:DNA helicase [Tanacetum coccineum]
MSSFAQWLLDVRNGQIGTPDDSDPENTSWLQDNAIICPKNDMEDTINSKILSLLSTTTRVYISYDDVVPHGHDGGEIELLYPREYLNTLTFAGLPPHRLELKNESHRGSDNYKHQAIAFRRYRCALPKSTGEESCLSFGQEAGVLHNKSNKSNELELKDITSRVYYGNDVQSSDDDEMTFRKGSLIVPCGGCPTLDVLNYAQDFLNKFSFSDQVNSLTKDCNKLLAELPDKDPYHIPSTSKELEDTAHIFQFHFDGGSTSKRRDFVLDKVFKKTPLLLPAPPVQNTLPTATLAEQQEYMPPPKAHSPTLLTTANNEPDINKATMVDLQATQPSILDSHTPTGTQEEDKPYELSPVAVEEVIFDVNSKEKVTKISKPKPAEDVAESSEDIHSTPPPMHVAREIPKGNEAGSLQRPSIWKALFKSDPTPESSEITKKSKHDS